MTVPAQLDERFRDAASAAGLLDAAYDVTDSPIGELLVAATDHGVCWIEFGPEETLDRLQRQVGAGCCVSRGDSHPFGASSTSTSPETGRASTSTSTSRRCPGSSGTCWTSSCESRTAK